MASVNMKVGGRAHKITWQLCQDLESCLFPSNTKTRGINFDSQKVNLVFWYWGAPKCCRRRVQKHFWCTPRIGTLENRGIGRSILPKNSKDTKSLQHKECIVQQVSLSLIRSGWAVWSPSNILGQTSLEELTLPPKNREVGTIHQEMQRVYVLSTKGPSTLDITMHQIHIKRLISWEKALGPSVSGQPGLQKKVQCKRCRIWKTSSRTFASWHFMVPTKAASHPRNSRQVQEEKPKGKTAVGRTWQRLSPWATLTRQQRCLNTRHEPQRWRRSLREDTEPDPL